MEEKLKNIIDKVRKPARYLGGEVNMVRKEHSEGRISVVLSYPDTYEVGMSYLGVKILYHLLNERDDIVCERVFAPWIDMEEELRSSSMKLFSLETRTDVDKFDILGFSLSHEVTYTNVLNILDLSGISVLAKERGEEEPIVIAGGECCFNPEPMSDFIDAFVIGDGEEALPRLVDAYKAAKAEGLSRGAKLKALASLENVYVPSFYAAEYSHNKFKNISPLEEWVPRVVSKASVADFENAYYPTKQLVPNTKIIHDRIAVEVMRGCPNQCRFCQASIVNRPVRVRSAEKVRQICNQTYKNTGYERIALLSLSSVNYPYLTDAVKALTDDFKERGVGISVPSLRVDEAFYDIPEMLSAIRKGGLTFAPESASGSIRKGIGKDIDPEVLSKAALEAYKHGWQRLKLYFMMGFPRETDDDVRSIITIAEEVSRLRKRVSRGAAEVKVSCNPFIPKPQTALQWVPMAPTQELARKRRILKEYRSKKVKIDVHSLDLAVVEGNMARGDRRMGAVIYTAWRGGAKMDGWKECFNMRIWNNAMEENGFSADEFARSSYSLGDKLPWSHIVTAVPDKYLSTQMQESGLSE